MAVVVEVEVTVTSGRRVGKGGVFFLSHRLSISSSCSRPSRSTLAGTAGGWSRCRWNDRKGQAIHSVSRWPPHPVSSTPAKATAVLCKRREMGLGMLTLETS